MMTLFHVTTKIIIVKTAFWSRFVEERQNTMHTAEDEDDMPKLRHMTNREAKKYIDKLRIYFRQESNEGSPIIVLTAYSDFVEMQAVKNSRQSTLDKYFH